MNFTVAFGMHRIVEITITLVSAYLTYYIADDILGKDGLNCDVEF
jgi:hypothetical protein